MNPKADPVEIANAYEDDPQAAQAEYGAVFRDDLIGFISMETLEAITQRGRTALPRSNTLGLWTRQAASTIV
jgi:hypothetical protein